MSGPEECQSVDSAYSRLETIIRNFSREKMSLEENITCLNRQLELRESDIADNNEILKTLTVERDRFKQIHEEDEIARYALEAMVTSCEKKINILIETLSSYDLSVKDIDARTEYLDYFNESVKKVQLKLYANLKEEEDQHLATVQASNEKVELLEEKCKSLELELNNQMNIAKEKECLWINENELKENELKRLLVCKEDLIQQIDSLTNDFNAKSDIIVELNEEKQQMESRLSIELDIAKDKENKLQENVKLFEEKCKSLELDLNDQMNIAKEKELFMINENEKKEDELRKLLAYKEDLVQQLDVSTKENKANSDVIVGLQENVKLFEEKYKSLELDLNDQMNIAKEKELFMINENEKKEDELRKLLAYKEDLVQQLDVSTKENKANSDVIVGLNEEKHQIEIRLLTELSITKEKQNELQDNVELLEEKCKSLELELNNQMNIAKEKECLWINENELKENELKKLLVCKEDLIQQIDSLTNDFNAKSDIIVKLNEEKQQMESRLSVELDIAKDKENELQENVKLFEEKCKSLELDLNDQMNIAKEKELFMINENEKKEDELRKLLAYKEDLVQQLDFSTKENKAKSDVIDELNGDKQLIESRLLVQLRITKEREDELQDSAKQNAKQLQIVRAGYEDLAKMLDITKNEKTSLNESHLKLISDKKQTELELNEELKAKKEKIDQLLEEVEALRSVQKRYLDLKKHLNSLMKEKSNIQSNNSCLDFKQNQNNTDKVNQDKNLNLASNGNVASEEEKLKKQDGIPKPTFRRSHSVTPTIKSPRGILKTPTDEPMDKKNVSFCSPLSFCVGLTSSSDSSSETDMGKDSQKEHVSTPQKRSSDKTNADGLSATEEKKNKLSDVESVKGRKFFRKKVVTSTPPAYRVQK